MFKIMMKSASVGPTEVPGHGCATLDEAKAYCQALDPTGQTLWVAEDNAPAAPLLAADTVISLLKGIKPQAMADASEDDGTTLAWLISTYGPMVPDDVAAKGMEVAEEAGSYGQDEANACADYIDALIEGLHPDVPSAAPAFDVHADTLALAQSLGAGSISFAKDPDGGDEDEQLLPVKANTEGLKAELLSKLAVLQALDASDPEPFSLNSVKAQVKSAWGQKVHDLGRLACKKEGVYYELTVARATCYLTHVLKGVVGEAGFKVAAGEEGFGSLLVAKAQSKDPNQTASLLLLKGFSSAA